MTDTIYAVSSGQPPAAIAIIRVSGPGALARARTLVGRLPPPRHAGLRPLRDAAGALLDRALVLVFPAPDTATGEDLVELHCHGGRAVVTAVEAALTATGARRAEAGEFTRRALLHGRIDLAQAESLADLLEAETEAQRVAALDGVEGRIGALVGGWLQRIAALSAAVEATLDFADEDDVGDDHLAATIAAMNVLAGEIETVLAAPSVERLRDGVRVVLAGPPNAGKSTLLNLLSQREAAIVSPVAGTTRDRVEAPVLRDGHAFLLIDTAGLTETADPVEAIGVARAEAAIGAADLLLWLGDDPPPRSEAIWVQPRADLPGRAALLPGRAISVAQDDAASVDALWRLVAHGAATRRPRTSAPLIRERQRECCSAASEALQDPHSDDPIIVADILRRVHLALGAAIGIDATEAMLDTLFGRFCIGK